MELCVKERGIFGKKVKSLRRKGLIPAELFGHGITNMHFSVPEKDFFNLYKKAGGHTVIQILTEKGDKISALISEVQNNPFSKKPMSILFHQIRADEEIEIKIPIVFNGQAPAEKEGLIIVRVIDEIEIKSLPDKIPHSFEVNLSVLKELGQSIYVNDLKIPASIKLITPADTAIATVTEQAKEEIEIAPAAETTVPEKEQAAETEKTEKEKTTEQTK